MGAGPLRAPKQIHNTMSTNSTKATKATTTPKAVTMDAATINATAAALLGKYKTISGLDGHAAALRDKYDPATWKAIRKAAQDVRAAEIADTAAKVRAGVFNYRTILGATYKALSKDAAYKRLCAFAKVAYKGTDTDTAAKLVRDFAPAVDATTGAPVFRVSFISPSRSTIYTTYTARELTDADALRVLKAALQGLAAAATKGARKATDTAAAALDNKRTPGAVVGVFAAAAGDAPGTYKAGDALTPKAGEKATTKAAKAWAAAVGRPVPDGCAPLAAVNADARRAHAEKAAAALARERAALAADATAAGMATTPKAPKGAKGAKAPKTAPADADAARAAMAAVDAFLTAEKAAAKAAAVTA